MTWEEQVVSDEVNTVKVVLELLNDPVAVSHILDSISTETLVNKIISRDNVSSNYITMPSEYTNLYEIFKLDESAEFIVIRNLILGH